MTWSKRTDCTVRDTGTLWFEVSPTGMPELHVRDITESGGHVERVYYLSTKATGDLALAMGQHFAKATALRIDALVDHIQRLEYPYEEHGGADE